MLFIYPIRFGLTRYLFAYLLIGTVRSFAAPFSEVGSDRVGRRNPIFGVPFFFRIIFIYIFLVHAAWWSRVSRRVASSFSFLVVQHTNRQGRAQGYMYSTVKTYSAAVRAHTASWLEDESNTTRGSTRGTTQVTVDRTHDKLQSDTPRHTTRFDSSCPGPRAPPHLPTSSQPHRLHGPWPTPRPLTHMVVLNLRSTSSASAPMPQLLLSPLTSHNLQATHGA